MRGTRIAALVLLVLLGVWLATAWQGGPDERSSANAAPSLNTSASAQPTATGGNVWALAAQATAAADAANDELVLDAAELQRRDEADCARLAPALKQLEAGAIPSGPGFEWADERKEYEAWLRRWIVALRQRGDERSLAVVDFLDPMLAHEDSARQMAASRRLNQRALRSGDGFVLSLAAQRPCQPRMGCDQPVSPERWVQLEPGNLSAWLAAMPSTEPLPEGWLNGLMQVTYDNSHRAELMEVLLSLPPHLPMGPRRLARDVTLVGINAAIATPSIRALTQHCRGGNDAQRCRALGEKLWTVREPTLMNWSLTLALARLSSPIDPRWEPRSRQVEAARQWSARESMNMIAEPLLNAFQCKADPSFERQVVGRLTHSEGTMLLAEIGLHGADMAELSAEFRKQNGRGLLQAPPTRAPKASEASR